LQKKAPEGNLTCALFASFYDAFCGEYGRCTYIKMMKSVTFVNRCKLASFTLRLALSGALAVLLFALLSGCGKSANSPPTNTFSLQGTLALREQGDLSAAIVRLWEAPEDAQLSQILAAYPSVGFSPEQMLFNPFTGTPLATLTPGSDGKFTFSGLSEGNYIVDADLEEYACPQPFRISLPGTTQMDTLWLVQPETVTGILTSSVWHTGHVYFVDADVIVPTAMTLNIESGALVLLNGDYRINVAGAIQTDGLPAEPIRFRLTQQHSQAGGDWGGLYFEDPANACNLTGIVFQGASTALNLSGGSIEIRECLFDAPETFAGYFSANTEGWVEHCIVRDGDQGLVADNCAPHFSNNVILRMSDKAITVKTNSNATLHSNVIKDCEIGIWSDWNTAPIIQYNLITGGFYGLEAQDGFTATIRYNEFVDQTERCIFFHVRNCYPVALEYNNFLNAPQNIIYVDGLLSQQADTVYAPNNYWDGAQGAEIAGRIIDGFDIGSPSNLIGPVVYIPYSSTPLSGAGP
jgi:hypothetical protein